jgi:two-component system, LytTR family, response regulator LytT
MRTIIIEDELLQANQLKQLLSEVDPSVEVFRIIQSVDEAVDLLRNATFDLIFLDIHLADGLCFEIFEKVKVTCPVIFITAYDKYAIDAFKHNGIDYILKPVLRIELKKSLEKFMLFTNQPTDYKQLFSSIRSAAEGFKAYKKRFITHAGKKLKIVTTDDIAYFYALGGGVFIRTIRNENLLVDQTLESLEEELDPYDFFRLNRKVISHVSSIKEMLPYSKSRIKIILIPVFEEDVVISYQNVKSFMHWVKK